MKKNKGIFLILATAFISGFAVFINKFGVSAVNPYLFAGLKNSLVAFLLVGWLLMMKDWRILVKLSKRQWFLLLGVGFLGGFVPFILFFKGLSMVSAAQAGFIHKTMFIFVFILAGIFLKEKIRRRYLISGLLLLVANLFLLNFLPLYFNLGSLLILGATFLWATENVISKYLLGEIPSRIVIWARMFLGSIFIFSFLFFTGQAGLIKGLTLEQLGWTIITSVILFGYLATWYTGLKYVKVSLAAVILLFAGPITSLLSLIFSNQAFVLGQWIGLCFTGAAILYLLTAFLRGSYGKRYSVKSRSYSL